MIDNIKKIKKELIEIENWKDYKISDLFLVKGSKTTPKKELEKKGKGIYPYITTTANNQGVSGYYNFFTEKGNVLTFDSAVLGTCFYQRENFSASDHVELGIPYYEKFNKRIGLFFQIVINKKNENIYNYGHKANQDRIKNTIIKLPSIYNNINNKYEPDWEYIENYMLYIEKMININEIQKNIKNIKNINNEEINSNNWIFFDFFYIFEEKSAKTGIIAPLKENIKTELNVNYISAGTKNNGCDCYVSKKKYIKNINSNCLTMGTRGEYNGNMFYQEEEFVNSNTCMILKYNNNFKFNKNDIKKISIFISTVWNNNKKYGTYGIYPTLKSLKEDKIKLPAKFDESIGDYIPDFEYMINYILNLNEKINE